MTQITFLKWAKGICRAGIACLAAFLLFYMGCFYAQAKTASVSLPVRQEVRDRETGKVQADAHVYYELTAEDGAPLPAGADGDCRKFSIQGTGSYVLSWDQMPGEGSYRYELRVSGSDAAQLQSSPAQMEIQVRVTDEYGAEAAVYLSDGKKGDLFFSHTCLQKTPEAKGGGKTNPSIPGQKRLGGPKTGDETNIVFYTLLMGISAALTIAALLLKKNRNIERKKHSKADH